MLLFEGTLSIEGQAIPARLELAIDLPALRALAVSEPELAALLGGSVLANPGVSGDTAGSPRRWSLTENGEHRAPPAVAIPAPKRAAGFEPIEVRDHPGRRITSEVFAQIADPAKIWAALAERFPWAGFKIPAGTPELTAGDIAGVDDEISPQVSQLEIDWQAIEPHLSELVDDEGRPAKGYQSRIAALLGGENAGAFRRSRVMPLVERLRAWVDEEWVFTTKENGAESDIDEPQELAS